MRVVVKAVQSSGKGVSYQARYIAQSEINREREGERPRLLFPNRGPDNLTYRAANHFLTGGEGDPLKKDLIHLIVSFEEKDFEALGAHDEERKAAMREIAREAMGETKGDLGVRDWRWVAGIHLNTGNPHIHFLIHKEIESDDPERTRLGNIPKRLLPGQVKNPDGESRPTEGVIGEHFVRALDRGITLEALRRGEIAPSPALASLLSELDASRTGRQVLGFEASLYEVSLHKSKVNKRRQASYESLAPHERRYLSERIEGKTRSLAIERGSDESVLFEATRKFPSLAGREVTREIIARGQETASGEPPDALHDPKAAFEERFHYDPYYETTYGKADWLSKYSRWLRDDYERGAGLKGQVLVIPAEEHELNPEIHDRPLFIHELRYALKEIRDPEKASEFHELATTIAGRNVSAGGLAKSFSIYYRLLKREGGEETGRELAPHETEARAEALEATLVKMRELASLMEELETEVSIEVKKPEMFASLEQVRESKLAAIHAEPAFGEHEDGEREHEGRPKGAAYVFNTAARKVNLRDDGLRFPAGISQETKELLVAHTLPWIDEQIESGVQLSKILDEIKRFYYEWHDSPRLTLTERLKREKDAYHRIGYYLKTYADERIAARERPDTAGQSSPFRITVDEPPPGLTKEARARLADETLPWIDRQIESGASRTEIYRQVRRQFHQVEVTAEDLILRPVAVPGIPREAAAERARIVRFCREYLYERFKDPETREINRSEISREAHRRMTEANSYKEINQAAGYVFKKGRFDWDRRSWIFSGHAPDHYTKGDARAAHLLRPRPR